jgi:hypothetical protein
MGPIEAKFRKRTPKSAELSERAAEVMRVVKHAVPHTTPILGVG